MDEVMKIVKNNEIVKVLKNNTWLAYGGLTSEQRDFLSSVDNVYIELCIGTNRWIPKPNTGMWDCDIYRLMPSYKLLVEEEADTPKDITMKEQLITFLECRKTQHLYQQNNTILHWAEFGVRLTELNDIIRIIENDNFYD